MYPFYVPSPITLDRKPVGWVMATTFGKGTREMFYAGVDRGMVSKSAGSEELPGAS